MTERKILSFDVGIQNLAYCIISDKSNNKIEDKEIDKTDYKILEWGIINLDDDKKTCEYCGKGGTCGKNAKFTLPKSKDSQEEIYYCSQHIKNAMKTGGVSETKIEKLANIPDNSKCSAGKCKKECTHMINKTIYCETHALKLKKELDKQIMPKKIKSQNSNHQALEKLAVSIFTKLESIKTLLEVDDVLIENQPSLINPVMKTISCMLYSFFMMNGFMKNKIKLVKFMSPQNKLKVNSESKKEIKKGETEREKYLITKGLGVEYCKALINHYPDKIKFLDNFKKKDDLCDAFLQGFYYLYCTKGVPEKLFKLVKDIKPKEKKNKQGDKDKGVDVII